MPVVKTVLLIDDDEIFNLIVDNTLRMYNFADQIMAFTSVADGLAYLRKVEDEKNFVFPDIIFLDINMPIQDGWDFLNTYRQFPLDVKSQTQLYLLSSSIDESDVLKSQQYRDVRDFIRKPLSKMNLDIIKLRMENEKS